MALTKAHSRMIEGSIVNVKDFGAVGDGVTDDTTAVQLAFNQAGNIIIDGNFVITSKIQVLSNSNITQTKGSYIKNTDTTETTIGGRPSTDNGVFEVACGETNITFDGIDIRGAWYGLTQPYRDNNIGINIKGRWDQYRLSETITGTSKNILIKECLIEGFAQSGIIADQIDTFKALNNKISKCGRDGIRMYGCVDFLCDGNTINSMSPGYDGVAPNLNVYGISATTVYQQPLSDYRSSERGIITNNTVTDCLTWKSLDTHGGRDIVFSENTCLNSHIGIGIDKGGLDNNGDYMPATRLVVSNNIIRNTQTDQAYKRAGITVFAHSNTSATIGQDVNIVGNYIDGFGGDTKDGGISLSHQKNVLISGNIIKNSINSAIYLALTCEAVVISNNNIRNVALSGVGNKQGIGTSSLVGDVVISSNSFQADTTPFQPINIDPSSNNSIKYSGSNISINCDEVGGWDYSNGGVNAETIAYGLVLSSGATSSGYKISSTRVSLGRYDVTISGGPWTKLFPALSLFTGTTTAGSISLRNVSGDVITVMTFDSTGALADTAFYLQVNGYK